MKTHPGPYLRFDQFTVNNEAFKQANSKQMALHDSRGYLWFLSDPNAREQLIRYDGTYYKSFGSAGWIDIKENEYHEIWAFNKKGLCRFDPITETFHYFRNPLTKSTNVGTWVMGREGKNWFWWPEVTTKVRSTIPFMAFDTRTKKVQQITPTKLINGYTGQADTAQYYTFIPRCVDAIGRVWGRAESTTRRTIGYYDTERNVIVWYPVVGLTAPEFAKSSSSGLKLDIYAIIADGKYIWAGGWERMGLLRFDTQTKQWKQFHFSNFVHNRIFGVTLRNDHQIWLQTDEYPLLFDKSTETLYTYLHQPDNPFTPVANIDGFVTGRNKSFWLGLGSSTNQATLGLLQDTKQYFTYKGDSLAMFRVLYKKNQKLYYSCRASEQLIFAEYDELTRTQTPLYKLSLNGISEQLINAALLDSVNQTVWLTGHHTAAGSLFRYDEKRRRVEPVRAIIQGLPAIENQLSNYKALSVVQDNVGNVWFPSFWESEVYAGNLLKFDSRTKQFTGFRAGTHGLFSGQIRAAMADSKGKIWLGYRGGGAVYTFDPVTEHAMVILKNTNRDGTDAMKIVDDPIRQKVWVARRDDGLWQYDRQTNTSRRVLNEPVLTVHLTKTGILWLKTLTSLIRFDPETGQQMRLGSEFDLHSFNWSPFIKTDDDEFFFEKFRFYDHDIKPDTVKPPVVFSFLKVFDHELHLPKSLNYTTDLTLNYNQNFFTIGFSALAYFQSEHNQYAYQLVGFNKDWIKVDSKPLAVFSNVPPGDYPFLIKGSNKDGLWSDVKTITIHITPPFWQTWWFQVLVFALLMLTIGMLYRFQLERRTLKARLEAEEARRLQKEAELSEKEAAFKLKLSETEMAALRSQMNPHFIFNCLNSIQYFTARHESDKASDYLTKFSRLIRMVLENSKSEKVTLANELETLRLYIEMEAMRFQQKVQYIIDVDDAIDTDSIEIPPLLLQPYVENAIWHGLMQKEEGGTVRIQVQQPQYNLLHVDITDDGVGRQKAAEYKSKSATRNKSFGMKLTAERLALINELYQIQTQIQLVDLTDEQGQARGTQVRIDIPI